jgi:hypothetical protein
MISAMPTNDPSLAPSRRAAPMPTTYANAAATTDSPSTETSQLTRCPNSTTSAAESRSGIACAAASTPSAAAPTIIPPQVITTGGSGSSVTDAERTKYPARLTAASSPQTTPAKLTPPPAPERFSISASPPSAPRPPATVSGWGRWPCRTHSQSTMSTTPRYSSSSAIPTGIRWMALK